MDNWNCLHLLRLIPHRIETDGDGMLAHIAFKNGRVFFKNVYIKTQEYMEEKQAGKVIYKVK